MNLFNSLQHSTTQIRRCSTLEQNWNKKAVFGAKWDIFQRGFCNFHRKFQLNFGIFDMKSGLFDLICAQNWTIMFLFCNIQSMVFYPNNLALR